MNFFIFLKVEKNEKLKNLLKEKIGQYLERVEKIKKFIEDPFKSEFLIFNFIYFFKFYLFIYFIFIYLFILIFFFFIFV